MVRLGSELVWWRQVVVVFFLRSQTAPLISRALALRPGPRGFAP